MTRLDGGTIWLVILGMGALTFLIRYSFIGLSRLELPAAVQRALRFLPAAVLSALVLPALLYPQGRLEFSLGNAHLLAGLAATLIAWRSKSTLLTLGVGMLSLWLLQSL